MLLIQPQHAADAQNKAAKARSTRPIDGPDHALIALNSLRNVALLADGGNKLNNPNAVDEAIDALIAELRA